MLQITPEGMKLVRQAVGYWSQPRRTKAPVTLAKARPAKKRSVTQAYRRKLIDQTAAIMRKGEPSVFAFEGFMRHGLRSGLCLRGWSWRDADELSADVVASALKQIGAKRPTYLQAQPEWTQEGVIMIERERCLRCGWNLPEGHWKFCSHRCKHAHHGMLHRRFTVEEYGAVYGDAS